MDGEIASLGRDHPLVRTQYFNEEIDAQTGMFPPARRALMRGDQPARDAAIPGEICLFTLDVAGQDEASFHNAEEHYMRNPGRDAVSLTIASVDLSQMDTVQAPIFRIVHRLQWTGLNHLDVFARLCALADAWKPQRIIMDATGVGEGLWALLDRRYPTRVTGIKFSAQKKSEIGYRFLAMIGTGRVRDCTPSPQVDAQYAACIAEILPGPQRRMRWGVPDGVRIHDDIVLADALLAEADALGWSAASPALLVRAPDPVPGMSRIIGQ